MNFELNLALSRCLDSRIQAKTAEIQALAAQSRADEANLQKAARNVYGIFHQLLSKAQSAEAYETLLETISAPWSAAKAAAAQHGDYTRIAIEDVKLEALRDIREQYYACLAEGKGQ